MKTLRFLVLGWLATATICGAQDLSDPGWHFSYGNNVLAPVTFGTAAHAQVAGIQTLQSYPAIAETSTPEIEALARGLQNDPVKIFNYVHDHIRPVFYFGSKKGAALTLLEKSGNDFDQCALLVALLRAAGYSPTYEFGLAEMPYDATDGTHNDLHHWLRLPLVNTNWTHTYTYFRYLTGTRGYPAVADYGDGNTMGIQRVWVVLPIGANTYLLDPGFKISEPVASLVNLATAMNASSNGLMSAASGTDAGNYVTNLNEASLRGTLTGYTTNLLNYLQSNAPNASVEEILGGWQIISATNSALSQGLLFPIDTHNSTISDWSNEPTNFMARFQASFARTNYQWYMPQFEGQRLSLTYATNGLAQLWQDDTLLVTNMTTASDTNVVLSVNQPFGTWNFAGNTLVDNGADDYSVTNTYQRTNAIYVLTYAFEPDWGWLSARQRQLDVYRQQGLSPASREVVSETLNVMQLGWTLQSEAIEQMFAAQFGTLLQYHNRFGRMAQEAGNGYYIDAYMILSGDITGAGTDDASLGRQYQAFDLSTYFASALEHGIIEQLQGSNHVAASTVKMLELGSTNGQAVYLASSTNWSTVSAKLSNYTAATKDLINAKFISQGYYVLLPQNGSNHIAGAGSWAGYGLVARYQDSSLEEMGMIISGAYHGGFADFQAAVVDINATWQAADSQPSSYTAAAPFTFAATGADPVDMADGTFQVEHTDLSVGRAEPRGITLARYYNGTRRYSNPAGMAGGWLHNYYATAAAVSAPQAGLGGTTPQQMASLIAATHAAASLYSTAPDPKNWTISALIAKWGIDQLYKNGVSVILGKDTVQFVRQPNGAYTPPANCTLTLIQTNGAYWLQQRHGNTFKFSVPGYLTNIVDQYGQALNVTYNSSNWVATVRDWKGRQLTFDYTGTPLHLTSVSDGTRTVNYSYSTAYSPQWDLTSFTDAEGKATIYAYDADHDITATLDAASRLVVSNRYDSLGHVATQYTEGDPNKTWRIFWSGWQTIAQDPAGGQQVYNYDDQSRIVGSRDALGHLTQTFYDGQNHVVMTISPLNEISQFFYDGNNNLTETIDPLGFTNQFFYDSQNRLYRSLDPLGNPTTFGYNAQFSLTGQTNGAGDWVNYAYNSDGTLHTRADTGGTTTYDSYDSWGQLTHITYPGGLGGETFVNSSLGDVTSHTDARGFVTTFAYNNRRQLTNTIAPTNLTLSVSFDAVGNVASTTDARHNVTSNTWSATRHLLTMTLPATPQGVAVITNGYDSRDWLTRSVDPLQHPTLYTNDLAGRLIVITDPVLRTTTFAFDADGRKLASANAANETNSQTWDVRGQPIQLTDGAGHFSTRAYDAAGNQIILTNRNGKKWSFQFDGANRLTNTLTPLGYSTALTFNHQGLVSFQRSPSGHTDSLAYNSRKFLTNRTDLVGTTAYQRDLNGNVTNEFENGLTNSWTMDAYNRVSSYRDVYGNVMQYRRNANGAVTNLIYPGNLNIYYALDSHDQVIGVKDWLGHQTTITRDLNENIIGITRPNGTQRLVGYDAAQEVTNILEETAAGFPIALFRQNWNPSGTMQWEFAAPLPHTNSLPTRTMTYNDDNGLATVNGNSVTSDLDGNLTYAPLPNGVFAPYNYDARNRLQDAGGVTNVYDSMNNRILQTQGTNVTMFVVDPNASLPRVLMSVKNNSVTNYYIYGAGLLYQVTVTATSTNALYYHYDYRGSTVALTDDSGNVTDRIEYSLYGTTTYRTGTSDTPFLFNGRFGVMTDPNGLLYMRARYYNPYLCRFINPDPSGFAGGLNLYAYANGNPVSLIDPFGLGVGTSIFGGLRMIGGGMEAAVGFTFAGVTSESIVGAVAGGAVGLHGVDSMQTGFRQMISGQQTTSLTSQGLQAAGMSQNAANLTDAGISIVGSLGAGFGTTAMRATELSATSISSDVANASLFAKVGYYEVGQLSLSDDAYNYYSLFGNTLDRGAAMVADQGGGFSGGVSAYWQLGSRTMGASEGTLFNSFETAWPTPLGAGGVGAVGGVANWLGQSNYGSSTGK